MAFGRLDDLIARIRTLKGDDVRPLAVLAGSGLTVGAVPSVNEILNAVRNALDEDDRAELDGRLHLISDTSRKYQEAFTFLGLRKPPSIRDRIIQLATLKAYRGVQITKAGDLEPGKLMAYEGDVDHWSLPPGVEALGRIWAGMPVNLRGPIVTTNFDPLCEVAIKRAGRSVSPKIVDADGAFIADVRVTDVPQVVHMHGYWRESSTLSMTSQLTLERPALSGSLRALLAQYTLLVVGYGAWQDALTTQLLQIIREQSARDLDVLWCYFEDEESLTGRFASDELFGQMRLAPGNLQFYTEIDVNKALPAIEVAISEVLEFPDTPRLGQRHSSSLLGWVPVGPIQDHRAVGEKHSAAIKFFDGRLPNWLDASSSFVPKRDIERTIVNEISAYISSGQSSFTVLLGASGEGKTTVLMQAALDLAERHAKAVVLFNADGQFVSSEEILAVPNDVVHILVLDEGYRSIDRLRDVVSRIQEQGRTRVHLLVASRDSDWTSVGGYSFAWNRYLESRTHKLRGINRPDASALIAAWERLGPQALGSLTEVGDREGRIRALMEHAAGERESEEGAFLGALLATRHGRGLTEHIRELLVRLIDRPIHVLTGVSDDSLLFAVAAIAFPHALSVRALDQNVLAGALNISIQELVGSVLLPLGDEAAVSYSVDSVLIRHRLIADAIVHLAPDMGIDLRDVVVRLVKSAVHVANTSGPSPAVLRIAYLSQNIGDTDLALAAAYAAVEEAPNRLSYRTSLSRAYRMARRPQDASAACVEAFPLVSSAEDALTGRRPFFTEWGVAEGNLGNWACNAVLVGAALQDLDSGPSNLENLHVTLSCLATSLRRLWERERKFALIQGLSGLVELGSHLSVSSTGREWIDGMDRFVFSSGGATVNNLDVAAKGLAEACNVAHALIEHPLPAGVHRRAFNFARLAERAGKVR